MEGEARFDVVVVGAGPAGIAAATCAAQSGRRVALVDDNGDVGGQIWRGHRAGRPAGMANREAARWIERLEAAGVQRLEGTRIGAVDEDRALLAQSPRGPVRIEYASLILATGARERFVPLPGWTLPGVVGVGGIQALAKSGLPVEGKRILIAGTGPLLLAVAGYLAQRGARIVYVAEQASSGSLLRFALRLIGQPRKLLQGIALRRQMRCGLLTGCWPTSVAAQGDRLRVRLQRRGRRWEEPCDYFACGFGLVANLELPALLGCRLEGRFVAVDQHQQTSVPEIYAAGELTGIGGVEGALVEGQIAGYAAAGRGDLAAGKLRRRDRAQRFAAAMERAFALRPELRELADDRTIVCRCEDVTFGQIKSQPDWRSAKLLTRCGMGACQGRLCGEATRLLLGYGPATVRPPIYPLPLGALVEPPPGEGPAGL